MSEATVPPLGLTEGASFSIGYQELVSIPNPADSFSVAWTMDPGYVYRILGFGGKLVTDAVVGSRQVFPVITDQNGVVLWGCFAGTNVPAGNTYNWSFNAHQPVALAAVVLYATYPMPDMLWPKGCTLTIDVSTFDAGDTFSNVWVLYEKYPEGALGYPSGVNVIRY